MTTLDTTSHNFTFETFTFGDISNSYLFDVAIINENDIWAVGEIRIADTSATGYTKYNAVHWDGNEWTLHRIMFYTICGQQHRSAYPAISVVAFSENDVWIAMYGNQVARLNDTTQIGTYCIPISVRKMWGTDSQNLYAVGVNGQIAHRNNIGWHVIESRTDVDFLDVWGTPDGNIVWVSGRDLNKTVLIKIEDQDANIVFEEHYPWQIQKGKISGGISSIWTDNENYLYATTPINVYRCLSNTNGEGKEIYPYEDYLYGGTIRIRGTGVNNIFTSGSNSSILHYNGYSWKRYEQFYDVNTYLYSSDTKGNLFVAVGDKLENILYYKAIIIVGKK
ncbi:MAG: glucosyl transferase [Ignavibacteriaceae bacterium]|nr:glucosyl transferase [Ignavibacteriaceae bacterium]